MTRPLELRETDILWDLQRRHLEEAEYLSEARADALEAPHYTLDELATGLEARLLAHVDGLRIGGPLVEERLLIPTLHDPNAYPERVAAAALACADPRTILAALHAADPEAGELIEGLVWGLQLHEHASVDALITDVLRESKGQVAASLLEVLARRGTVVEPWVAAFTDHDELPVRRAAARALRTCPDPAVLTCLGPLAEAEDPELRHAALETALVRGMAGALESMVYWAFTPDDSPRRREALVWVAQLGGGSQRARVLDMLDTADTDTDRIDALWASGFGGSPLAVERCLPLLADEALGPVAGELVCAITGLDAEDERWWRSPPAADGPEDGLPRLVEDGLEADLDLEPEAFLPVPEPEAILGWWAEVEGRFDRSTRYLGGQRLGGESLAQALRGGPLRRRHALAGELGARTRGAMALSTRALTRVQAEQLARLPQHEAWVRLDFQRAVRG